MNIEEIKIKLEMIEKLANSLPDNDPIKQTMLDVVKDTKEKEGIK